jgi:hypothetical protein
MMPEIMSFLQWKHTVGYEVRYDKNRKNKVISREEIVETIIVVNEENANNNLNILLWYVVG